MRQTKLFLLVLTLSVCSLPLLAQVNDTYVIPVAGYTLGANGTKWVTELNIFNPQGYTLKVRADFIPKGGSQGIEVTFPVYANETFTVPNALNDLFQVTGAGGILLATFPEDNPTVPDTVVARAFLVTSRTYNNASSGTYGQSIPGTWVGLQADGITAIANGVTNDDYPAYRIGYRTNVGVLNLSRSSIEVMVAVYDADGSQVGESIPFNVEPQGLEQFPLSQALADTDLNGGSLEFWIDNDPLGDAVVFPYASVVDNRSGDAIYKNPVLLATGHALYPTGKTLTAASANPIVGKRLDLQIARRVSASARSLGEIQRAQPVTR
ncbi:MAG: hypothetical protein WBX15_10405 [Thermoanaerobaculia bacterium]